MADNNPALFVSLRKPHRRLKTSGIEAMLKKMGEECNVNHVHPHKFRNPNFNKIQTFHK